MKISLKENIEIKSAQFIKNHYFFSSEANINNRSYDVFLKNVNFLISHTIPCLKHATNVSSMKNEQDLALFFAEKIEEETGHDIWAEEDYKNTFNQKFILTDITQSMKDLTSWLYKVIENDPSHYLAYILYAEYITVLAGSEVVSRFQTNVKSNNFTCDVLDKHVELDKDHIVDDIFVIEQQIQQRNVQIDDFHEIIEKAHVHLMGFYEEIANLEQHREISMEA